MNAIFIYKIEGVSLSNKKIDEINSLATIKERINNIGLLNGSLAFDECENSILHNNLLVVDTDLPSILSRVIYLSYVLCEENIKIVVENLAIENFLGYNYQYHQPYYEYKLKRFLVDLANGMNSIDVWTGQIKSYNHLGFSASQDSTYNFNDYENYLLNNTKLETASGTRHGFGQIYEQDGALYFKLNLQIRFIR